MLLFLSTTTSAESLQSRYDPLASWLWNLTIAIPDQHFKEGIIHLSVLGMECTHFALEGINSTYVPTKKENGVTTESPLIDLVVSGISATCTGKYRSTGLSGKVSATVTSPNPKALGMDLVFISNSTTTKNSSYTIRMATSVSVQQCAVDLQVSNLHFSGSISAKIINLFQKTIRGYVTDALSTQICPLVTDAVDDQGTQLLKQVDDYLLGLLSTDSMNDSSFAATTTTAIQRSLKNDEEDDTWKWNRDAPLAVTLLKTLNGVLSRYLDKGLFLDLLNLLLGVESVDEDCGYFFHGVNGLVHQLTNGAVEFAIPDQLHFLKNITIVIPKYASISIMPKTVGVAADRFDELTLLRPQPDESFWTKVIAKQGLNLTLSMDIQVSAIEGGAFSGDPLVESFQLTIDTTSLDVSGNLSLDLNNTRFQSTTINHIISAIQGDRDDLGCSLHPLEKFGIEELMANVSVQSISLVPHDVVTAAVRGSLEYDIDAMLNNFLSLFLTEYDTLVTLALGGLLNGPVKQLAQEKGNEALQNLIADLHPTGCDVSGKVNDSSTDYANFSQVAFLEPFNEFLNNSIGGANKYFECLSRVLTYEVEALAPKLDYLNASLQLQSLKVEGAGSMTFMELALPRGDGYHLNNGMGFGVCDGNETEGDPLNCTGPRLLAEVKASAPFMNMSGDINLTASMGMIQESLSALVLFDLNALRNLSLSDLLSCHACFAKPASGSALYAMPMLLKQLDLQVHSIVKGDEVDPIQVFIDSADFDTVSSTLTSGVSWVQRYVLEAINEVFSHLVSVAETNCDSNDKEEKKEKREKMDLILTTIVYLLPFYILSHILYVGYNQVKSEARPSNYEPLIEFERSASELSDTGMDTTLLREKNSSLMTNESIPSGARHLFPIALIAIMALLIGSNLSVGASVDLVVSTEEVQDVIRLPSLFAFSLGNTIREMYSSGIYVLLFIVVVFSGIWPYLKLLMMLWTWVAPESIFSPKKRGKLLFSLDALSKFSLVDTFVLVIFMVSFRFHLGELAMIDVFVNPRFGFYGFLIATTASLLAGHIELHTHRCCMTSDNETNDDVRVSLFSHQYYCRGAKHAFSTTLKMLFVATMVVVVALLSIGSFMESFTFEFGGLAGAMLGDSNKKSYSLISIGTAIPESVEDPNGPGIMFLQVVYFFYASIMPAVCLLALCILMIVPLKKGQMELWLTVAEVANAWSAVEVFVLSIVAALFEISTFASFIIGNKCDLINQILEQQFDDELHGDDRCYSVNASVGGNVAFLVVGVVLNSWLVSKLLRIAQVVVEERSNPQTGLIPLDDPADPNVVQRFAKSAMGKHLFVLVVEDELATPLLGGQTEVSPQLEFETETTL